MALQYTFAQMEYLGVFDAILPFILIFTIVFAVMQKVKIFGTEAKAKTYNAVVALVMGGATIYPHIMGYYPPDKDIVVIINRALPNVGVVVVAVVMALILIGVMGRRFELAGNSLSGWIAIAAFALIVFIFGSAARWWDHPLWLSFMMDPDLVALIIVVLVFAILIWWITKEDDQKDPKKKSFGEQFGELLATTGEKK
jgi:hypothetical protein